MRQIQKNNKGLTLIELIVVVAILAVLAAVLVPQYTQYVEKSRKAVCESSREEFMHAFTVYQAINGDGETLANVVSGGLATDFAALKCPSGGSITVVDGKLSCSLHGGIGSDIPDVIKPGDEIFKDVVVSGWTAVCESVSTGGKTLTQGSVFVHDGKTYVVWRQMWFNQATAEAVKNAPETVGDLLEFDANAPLALDKFVGGKWTVPINLGSFLIINDEKKGEVGAYVFVATPNEWAYPPGNGWLKLK